jgi:hypothetical protein
VKILCARKSNTRLINNIATDWIDMDVIDEAIN